MPSNSDLLPTRISGVSSKVLLSNAVNPHTSRDRSVFVKSSDLAGVMMPGPGCNLAATRCNDAESGGQYCQKWDTHLF